jgi:hypothetical protein
MDYQFWYQVIWAMIGASSLIIILECLNAPDPLFG